MKWLSKEEKLLIKRFANEWNEPHPLMKQVTKIDVLSFPWLEDLEDPKWVRRSRRYDRCWWRKKEIYLEDLNIELKWANNDR